MDFDRNKVRLMVNEDRLSGLPDELLHQIFSCIDTKFVVQTCLLSPRWKLLWTSMSCLTFSSLEFDSSPKFTKFVTNVLSHRNHQIDVSSVKLNFRGAANQVFVRNIAHYAFSHNVQELTVISSPKNHHRLPLCLFSSRSLKHFTFSSIYFYAYSPTPKTPWDFPALTTLHLSNVVLRGNNTGESVDLFSKCVNLKNLTLKSFRVYLELPKDCFHSLNKVSVTLNLSRSNMPYKEEDARETINMLQELHSARFLTLNLDIVECLSSFPDLVSLHPSPFSNLICVNIDSSREEAYKVKLSTEAINFLLENSPNATFITDLPEEPPTKEMLEKEAIEKKAKLIADIKSRMMELQASVEQENMLLIERKHAKKKTKAFVGKLMAILLKALTMKKMMQTDSNKNVQIEALLARLTVSIQACVGSMHDLYQQEHKNFEAIHSKEMQIKLLLKNLPTRERTEYSRQLKSNKKHCMIVYSQQFKTCLPVIKRSLMSIKKMCLITSQHFKILPGLLKIGRYNDTNFHDKGKL